MKKRMRYSLVFVVITFFISCSSEIEIQDKKGVFSGSIKGLIADSVVINYSHFMDPEQKELISQLDSTGHFSFEIDHPEMVKIDVLVNDIERLSSIHFPKHGNVIVDLLFDSLSTREIRASYEKDYPVRVKFSGDYKLENEIYQRHHYSYYSNYVNIDSAIGPKYFYEYLDSVTYFMFQNLNVSDSLEVDQNFLQNYKAEISYFKQRKWEEFKTYHYHRFEKEKEPVMDSIDSLFVNIPVDVNRNDLLNGGWFYYYYIEDKVFDYPINTKLIDKTLSEDEISSIRFQSRIELIDSMIASDTIKSLLYKSMIAQRMTPKEVKLGRKAIANFPNLDPKIKGFLLNEIEAIELYSKGSPLPEFIYPDNRDSLVNLSSLKGKPILIDLWATWCFPCVEEIPYFTDLAIELGDVVHFVGISSDNERGKAGWKKMVEEKEMKGIQLICTDKEVLNIKDFFNVNGIPHFIIIDKEGNIFDGDSKRPSDPELRDILLELTTF